VFYNIGDSAPALDVFLEESEATDKNGFFGYRFFHLFLFFSPRALLAFP